MEVETTVYVNLRIPKEEILEKLGYREYQINSLSINGDKINIAMSKKAV